MRTGDESMKELADGAIVVLLIVFVALWMIANALAESEDE
jgi:hypothetical protein